jgi:trehalose/maltose hydrolase-like predicted phosphorylase
MTDWQLLYDAFDPGGEPLREALCTLGNGYFATRGAAEEAHADDLHYPGTYLAGGYNRLQTEVAGRMIENLVVRGQVHEFRPGIKLELPCRTEQDGSRRVVSSDRVAS